MQIYNRTGPNTAVSYSLGGWLWFWFFVFVGALPVIAVGIALIVALVAVALVFGLILAAIGMTWKLCTGKDARIPVPGSEHGHAIEYWMEDRGWIRLPKRLHQMPTRST